MKFALIMLSIFGFLLGQALANEAEYIGWQYMGLVLILVSFCTFMFNLLTYHDD